jgi:hypothetical protein
MSKSLLPRALDMAREALIEAAECLRSDYPGCEDEWLNPIGIIVDHCETAIEAIDDLSALSEITDATT